MKNLRRQKEKGFSIMELLISMTVMMVLLGAVSSLLSSTMGTRNMESQRADALTSARAALNVMSREISNSGYGLTTNGVVSADSHSQRIHIRANLINTDTTTTSPNEDITYFYDSATQSIVRYDPYNTPQTSVVVNKISNVTFTYFNYTGSNSTPTQVTTPTSDTGRVRINVTVNLENVHGQPTGQKVTFTSDVTLRNSDYMLNQY